MAAVRVAFTLEARAPYSTEFPYLCMVQVPTTAIGPLSFPLSWILPESMLSGTCCVTSIVLLYSLLIIKSRHLDY
ncbi:hypothetical protein BDW68DRAFT_155326 [Aspergillus falconensis]